MAAPIFDRSDILRTAQIFHESGDVFEMRIPKAGRYKTISGYFKEPSAFADAVVGLADEGFTGYYFTINPCDPTLFARTANTYKRNVKETTADKDIIRRRWLPIDLDPKRLVGISSSEDEHAAALQMVVEIRRWLIEDLGWPEDAFIRADSGNGGHLSARIDLSNDDGAKDLVKRCLETLDSRFSNDEVKVDTTTYNAARIWKIYGTMARKGSDMTDRPHRLARLRDVPDNLQTVTREQLVALAAMLPKSEPGKSSTFDPSKYAQEHGANVLRIEPWTDKGGGKWKLAILGECPFDSSHNRGEARIGVRVDGKRSFGCFHDSCQGNDWHALRDLWEPERRTRAETARKNIKCEDVATVEYDDSGDIASIKLAPTKATKTIMEFMVLAMSSDSEDVYYFNGQIYKPDGARIIDKALVQAAGDAVQIGPFKEVMRRIRNDLLDNPVVFEPDPYLLGVQNGVADLRTGEVREYRLEDLILDQIDVTYDPAARCPAILGFLSTITPNVIDRLTLIDFLVTLAVKEAFPFILFLLGLGRNGKGIYERLLMKFFGKTAFRNMEIEQVTKNNFAQSYFHRKRGWIATEAPKNQGKTVIGMDFIKSTSGEDMIDTDQKNKDRLQFDPYFQTIVDTNNMPKIDDNSLGMIDRFGKVDLPYHFVDSPDPDKPLERQKDPALIKKLTTPSELSGLLNLLLFRSQVIAEGKTITKRDSVEMFAEYATQSSSMATFVSLFCEYDENLQSIRKPTSEIYEAYKEWCTYKVGEIVNDVHFGRYLRKFCKGREPARPNIDGKKQSTYPGLMFHEDLFNTAMEELRLSRGISKGQAKDKKGQVKDKKEFLEIGQCISKGQEGQVKLWTEIIERFGPRENNPISPYTRESVNLLGLPVLLVQSRSSEPNKETVTCPFPVHLPVQTVTEEPILENIVTCPPEEPVRSRPVCAVCGADLVGHGTVEKGGKVYCALPGCGYPARGDVEVLAWFGLDNPLMYAAHKAAGGMTSIYRQIGIGCQRLISMILQDELNLSEEQTKWSYSTRGTNNKIRTLSLDGRINLDDVADQTKRSKVREWMTDVCNSLNIDNDISNSLHGMVFEVRQGYKSKDSKRQNADIANAATAYTQAYLPCLLLLSMQLDGDMFYRYHSEKWAILMGRTVNGSSLNSTYYFMSEVIGYDLASFFETHAGILHNEIAQVLETLLRVEG